ncbi:M48 family metallopeptidase [Schleiferia thermophila]|jgi:predicted Zn-dependent protease|uniref:M48 family metallopeptidase n=1 Tax=Schleiferia thermophila TaxID=884107 RepID=UPI0004E66445|nr:M48 family metallopeptidase [Schleiferia thermophila]KFD40103.1 peptidase M48 [Schleiferia thermophila str. Yellowstone]PMB30037.1 peptidase M48 [Fischerella thermalis CCMEE 5319]
MKQKVLKIFSLLLLVVITSTCKKVPITGRKQLAFIPASELNTLSFSQYQQIKEKEQVITGTPEAKMVERVGRRIQKAVEDYMAMNNQSHLLRGFEWEFILIKNDAVNAWCMPGGKVAFYTGILPVCQNEEGVAVVMGHEVAHAIAQHGNERMSQALLQQFGGVALAIALRDKPSETQAMFLAAYGVGTTLGALLPFSRLHESEADRLGLIFMAMAGYHPDAAPKFWERMARLKGGTVTPEFLSTHPSDQRRINDLNAAIPEALKYYKPQ